MVQEGGGVETNQTTLTVDASGAGVVGRRSFLPPENDSMILKVLVVASLILIISCGSMVVLLQ